jgi:D-serine deaminase-like pyridoxal phosphate-dependent protein
LPVIGTAVADLDTPAVLIDLDRLDRNIAHGAEVVARAGAEMRPHCKTHKTAEVARRQLAAGAVGLTVAKLGEAEALADASFDDIFVANEVVGAAKTARAVALARRITLAIGVDHLTQAQGLSAAFQDEARPLRVMIEVDTGQQRGGVEPGPAAAGLAEQIVRLPGLQLAGVFTHEGHDYDVPDTDLLPAVGRTAQQAMVATAQLIRERLGVPCRVSVGSTPSLIAGVVEPGVDEVRTGTYVYYDASMANVIGDFDSCALTVLATVVNRPTSSRTILDAGTKALSHDRRGGATILHTPGYGHVLEHPEAVITGLSDEHGVVTRGAEGMRIGEKVRIIPNHACPVSNLVDSVYAIRGDVVEEVWKVVARGRTT